MDTASGNSDTLVSPEGSFNTPIIIVANLVGDKIKLFCGCPNLKPHCKVLGLVELRPKENKSQEEDVDSTTDCRMLTDLTPCLFHFNAPVNVVEYEDAVFIDLLQKELEVGHRGCIPVVAINKCNIHRGQILKQAGQHVIEVAKQ